MIKNLIIKNFNWLLFDNLLRIFGGVFIGIWAARCLGPHDFGILNYAIAFISFFIFLPNLGLDQIIVRELTKYPKKEYQILGTAFLLKLTGSLLAYIIIIILSIHIFKNEKITKNVIIIISSIYFFKSIDVLDCYFQSKILSKYVVFARDISFTVTSIIKIYLIINNYKLIYFAYIFVLEVAISSSILIYIYNIKSNFIKKWSFNIKISKELMRYSWPLMFSSLLISIHTNIDQVMINAYLNKYEVGIYSAATRLSGFWLFIPTIITTTLLPYFIKLKSENHKSYEKKLLQLYSLMFWLGASVGLITLLIGEDIIVLLYGEPYRNAFKALSFNIWSGIFISQAISRGIWLVAENLQKYRLYNNLIAVFVNISGNMILIPLFGITGAAISTLVTQGLSTWGLSFLWKPLRKSNFDLIKSSNPLYMIGK